MIVLKYGKSKFVTTEIKFVGVSLFFFKQNLKQQNMTFLSVLLMSDDAGNDRIH